ncbi:MAG: energy-coupling factor transporter transmembrane component T [Lentihominibacter sp.]
MNTIPEWMTHQENYIPETDRDGFINRSLLSVMSVMSRFRTGSTRGSSLTVPGLAAVSFSAPARLMTALLIIILSSCSRNMFFTYCMIALLLVCLCAMDGGKLKGVFAAALAAAGLSALVLLPAAFLGSPRTILTVSLKVFLSVGLLGHLAATTPWNKITEGFRFFMVPDIMIFTFDITLKYIAILGDICLDMLNALKLRSVGKNRDKSSSISGILGFAFLKSRHMAEEMCGAMACRGFEGEYHRNHKGIIKKWDLLLLLFGALLTALFIYL